jgi:hypothetical protein
MAEPISTLNILDRLGELVSHARAVEMAISGSASIEPGESKALNRISEMLVDAVTALRDEVDSKLEAEREAKHSSAADTSEGWQ